LEHAQNIPPTFDENGTQIRFLLFNIDNLNRKGTTNSQREQNKTRLDGTILYVSITGRIQNIGNLSDKKPLVSQDQATGADLVPTTDTMRRLDVFTKQLFAQVCMSSNASPFLSKFVVL